MLSLQTIYSNPMVGHGRPEGENSVLDTAILHYKPGVFAVQYVDPSILPLIVLYYAHVHVHGFRAPVYAVRDAICVKSVLFVHTYEYNNIAAGMYINATYMYSK